MFDEFQRWRSEAARFGRYFWIALFGRRCIVKFKPGDKVKPRDLRSSFHPMIGEVSATYVSGCVLVDFPGHWSVPFPNGGRDLIKVKPNDNKPKKAGEA